MTYDLALTMWMRLVNMKDRSGSRMRVMSTMKQCHSAVVY